MKHHDRKEDVEEGVNLAYTSPALFITEGVRAGTWMKEVAYWLAPHGLPSLLYCRIQDHLPKDSTTLNGLEHPP